MTSNTAVDELRQRNGIGGSVAKKAAIYCRVSTPSQEEDSTSLENQEKFCREYAAKHGYGIIEGAVYWEVHTGTQLWERSHLTALREAVRQGQVQTVIADATDRLSRDPVHLGVILSEAEYYGACVEFVSEPLDDTPEGQLIRFVRRYVMRDTVWKQLAGPLVEGLRRREAIGVSLFDGLGGCGGHGRYSLAKSDQSAVNSEP